MDAMTSDISTMLPLMIAVLSASLLGSLHCAGMCGGLMFFALGPDSDTAKRTRAKLQCAYHGGRMVTYTILGIGAGTIGQAIDFGGSYLGLQRAAAVFAGVMMIGFGLITLARLRGVRIAHVRVPAPLRRGVERAQRAAFSLTPFKRAMSIGLLTTLLPCGWLYAYAFIAAGTASPLWGGLTMLIFWMGTLPVMVSLGAGIQFLTGRLNTRLPYITAGAVVLVGVMTATGRIHAPEMSRENLGLSENSMQAPSIDDVHCPLCEPSTETGQEG
jgi:sulfite exporter TauE/SafE